MEALKKTEVMETPRLQYKRIPYDPTSVQGEDSKGYFVRLWMTCTTASRTSSTESQFKHST